VTFSKDLVHSNADNLIEIDPGTGKWVAIPFGRTRTLSAPTLIITPPSPERDSPLDEAGGLLTKAVTLADTLPRYLNAIPTKCLYCLFANGLKVVVLTRLWLVCNCSWPGSRQRYPLLAEACGALNRPILSVDQANQQYQDEAQQEADQIGGCFQEDHTDDMPSL
jgi:hypothetical protein